MHGIGVTYYTLMTNCYCMPTEAFRESSLNKQKINISVSFMQIFSDNQINIGTVVDCEIYTKAIVLGIKKVMS